MSIVLGLIIVLAVVGTLAKAEAYVKMRYALPKPYDDGSLSGSKPHKPELGMEAVDPNFAAEVEFISRQANNESSSMERYSPRPIRKLHDKGYAAHYLRVFGPKNTKE